jgi:hypothetical protein
MTSDIRQKLKADRNELNLYCIELNVTSSEDLETIEEYLNYILNSTDKRIQSFEIVDIEEHC